MSRYTFLGKFNNYQEFKNYRNSKLYKVSILSTNTVTCQNCTIKDHKMTVQYVGCSNEHCFEEKILCKKSYKIQTCLKSEVDFPNKVRLFERDKHNSRIKDVTHWGIFIK